MNTGISAAHTQAICDILASCPRVQEVILFGSRAMGNYKPASDIDLCLRGDDISFDDVIALRVKLNDLPLVVDIDLLAENMIQSAPLLEHIHTKGILIFQKN